MDQPGSDPMAGVVGMAAPPLDVLVIGGGIVGAGIARDAAMRGDATEGRDDRGMRGTDNPKRDAAVRQQVAMMQDPRFGQMQGFVQRHVFNTPYRLS